MDIPDYDNSSEEEEKIPRKPLNKKAKQYNIRGWKDLLLKDELKRSIRESGYESPSSVQMAAIPAALQGSDLLCQARSGMGKTAVFVISVLHQMASGIDFTEDYSVFNCLVICHTRQLAHQISKIFRKLGKYFKSPELRIGCYYGGITIQQNSRQLLNQKKTPHIVIGTPGRLVDLVRNRYLKVDKLKYLVIDECDKVLCDLKMRDQVQEIFIKTPMKKQVMMFSATMPEEIKIIAKKFMNSKEVQILIDEGRLVLHGLKQYHINVIEEKKFKKLIHILDTLPFNQAIVFVNRVDRAKMLHSLLHKEMFNPICLHSALEQHERIQTFEDFRDNKSTLLIATDLVGRGIDIQRVNLVINFDFPFDRDTYLHRVGRAGRFGTRGLNISFIKPYKDDKERCSDTQRFYEVQRGFEIKIEELPKQMDAAMFL